MSLTETLSPSPAPSPWRHLARAALEIDRVVLVLAAVILGLMIFDPDQAVASIDFALASLAGMMLWLVPAVGFAAWAKATGADRSIAAAFAGHPTTAIVLAALVGALSPLCSCGVVALVVNLLKAGVPVAPVMAFWIASPLMDPGMFLVTWGGLGLEMAVVKTVAAVVMGLVAGGAAAWTVRAGLLGQPLRPAIAGAVGTVDLASVGGKPVFAFWREPHRLGAFAAEARKTSWFLLRWLSFAFVLESLMLAWTPADSIAHYLGGASVGAIPLAVAIGIPAYLNGYAAVPLIGGLIDLGMDPAVGLAFLLAGGVSSIPAMAAVWAAARPRLFGLYLGLGVAGSLLAAYAYAFYRAIV